MSKRYCEGLDAERFRGVTFTKMLSAETGEAVYEQVEEPKKIIDYLESKMY